MDDRGDTIEMRDRRVLEGPIVRTLIEYAIPSLIALLAISTTSLVDGVFVGRFVGADALAAVGLLVPYFTLLFGVALMLAVGGTVRAGRHLGADEREPAAVVFATATAGVLALGVVSALAGSVLEERLFRALGAPDALLPAMRAYYRVIAWVLPVQLTGLVLYYFVRLDGRPRFATVAVACGAMCNLVLDTWFVAGLGWGLRGAALATGLAQVVQLGALVTHFAGKRGRLRLTLLPPSWRTRSRSAKETASPRDCSGEANASLPQHGRTRGMRHPTPAGKTRSLALVLRLSWGGVRELASLALTGFSELVNEVSAGIVLLVFNFLMLERRGAEGVAAFSVVNYAIFASLMVFYGVADALHPLVSQNLGAGRTERVRGFARAGLAGAAALGALFFGVLTLFADRWAAIFLSSSSPLLAESSRLLRLVSPLFLVNGLNVVTVVYFASSQRSLHAALLSATRTLLLPVATLLALYFVLPEAPFVIAFPCAEWLALGVALPLLARVAPELAAPEANAAQGGVS